MLGVIGNKFSIGRETYHPFSAELHYFRIEKRYWSICFERIKRAGFRIISSAVPWNVHQDEEKHFDFNGYDDPRNDLVVFLELAREFGFKVILRPGPWVAGQLEYGGLPKYLFNDIKLFARDAEGKERRLPDDYGVDGGYLPSYLHKNFQYHLRNFFKVFIETTKNYVHPRGPIFMVELDYETSFGRLLEPDSADYNPQILSAFYPPFLEGLYGEVKKLNACYRERNAGFADVDPPKQFTNLDQKQYPKVLDWFRFREMMLNQYLEQLEEIFKSYTVEPLIFRSLYFRKGDLQPAFNLVPSDRSPFLGSNVFPEGSYFDLVVKARFLKSEYGFAFATSFTSGMAAGEPEREEQIAPIKNNQRRFYFAAAVAAGFKGLNHYMFVDRDRWYGAPLHNDGTISDGYRVARQFNTAVSQIGLEEMSSEPSVAVVGNRLYSWLAQTSSSKTFTYIPKLLYESAVGFLRDLMRLKLPFGIHESLNAESLKKYKLLFVASAEIMSERDQETIIELVKSGVTVFLCGLMPKMDENFKPCQILANHFRIRTTSDYRIGTITHKNGSFPGYMYASIRTTDDSKVKKLVKVDSKVVGVCSSRLKGNLFLFTFDIASGGNHQKLSFLESVLESQKISSYLYCSDPSVDLAFMVGDKRGLLAAVAPPPGELSDCFEADEKEVIVKADLRAVGFKAAKFRLINIFAGEDEKPLRITAKELRDGIPLRIKFPDGLIFVVDKR
ncbi:MAG: beta-galactosidase [Candidatus Zixiibacteriota bacterium]|nr:MAG: beta-galactosidase [candidate division Zixibacteria bacterium]